MTTQVLKIWYDLEIWKTHTQHTHTLPTFPKNALTNSALGYL